MLVMQEVTLERIGHLLTNALEGGSNYWYNIKEFVAPPEIKFRCWDEVADGGEKKLFKHIDYPLNAGGALIFDTLEDDEHNGKKEWRFDLDAAQRGIQLMSEKYPHHYADFLRENDGAITADVFLQLALFGELIYG